MADNPKIAVSLGHVVLICIHFAKAMNLNLQNTMIFKGHKSLIHSSESLEKRSQPFKLFLTRGDRP
jgi:hypothetical protein